MNSVVIIEAAFTILTVFVIMIKNDEQIITVNKYNEKKKLIIGQEEKGCTKNIYFRNNSSSEQVEIMRKEKVKKYGTV